MNDQQQGMSQRGGIAGMCLAHERYHSGECPDCRKELRLVNFVVNAVIARIKELEIFKDPKS